MSWRREGVCLDCGECCGSNGVSPFPKLGWEAVNKWSLDDIVVSYALFSLLGFGQVGEDEVGVVNNEGSYKITGKNHYYTWQHTGKGTIPMKDISVAHDGSSYNQECPFLKDDPGDGTRPCALKGTQEDGSRKKFCRPEENTEYVPANDIWDDSSKEQWETDHPSCSYTWIEVV